MRRKSMLMACTLARSNGAALHRLSLTPAAWYGPDPHGTETNQDVR